MGELRKRADPGATKDLLGCGWLVPEDKADEEPEFGALWLVHHLPIVALGHALLLCGSGFPHPSGGGNKTFRVWALQAGRGSEELGFARHLARHPGCDE